MRNSLALAVVLVLFLSGIALGCSAGESISVPIEVTNANRVGAVAFRLIYDSSVLEVQGVDPKELASGSQTGFNPDTPGRVVVAVGPNAPNINGSGVLVEANFKVLNTNGSTTFRIEVLETQDLDTREPVETDVSDGSFSAGSVQSPTITFLS